jgi:hypothetical protein
MYCEKYHATIKDATCLARQEDGKDPGCVGCKQGAIVFHEHRVMIPEGHRICRNPDCPYEGKPLPEAEFYSKIDKYCKKCRLKRQQAVRNQRSEERKAKKQEIEARLEAEIAAKKNNGKTLYAKPEALKVHPRMSLLVDFTKAPEILAKIQSMADQEMRSPENQLLYLLKTKTFFSEAQK